MTIIRAAELFAGVGGFRLGLSGGGIQVVWSNQWEPGQKNQWASRVYARHFGVESHSNIDLKIALDHLELDDSVIPDFDLLVGGFPCQDYSVAKSLSTSKGLEGKKGVLWWEIHRLLKLRAPKYVLLENVDRLLASPALQRGRDFAIMLSSLSSMGYKASWRVINASDFGHAQKRRRIFIFAQKQNLDLEIFENSFPSLPPGRLTEFGLDGDLLEVSQNFNSGGKSSPFLSAGIMDDLRVQTWRAVALKKQGKVLGELILDPDQIPEEYWIPSTHLERWKFLKGRKVIDRSDKSGFAYQYSEGSMAFPDKLDEPARTVVTGEGGVTPSRFKHVVMQQEKFRRLTPIELERVNEFPDNWTKLTLDNVELSPNQRAFLMGNALVVGVVEKLAKELRKAHEAQSGKGAT